MNQEHINFICKTAFLEIGHLGTVHHYFINDTTETLVTSLVLSHTDYCIFVFAGLFQSLVGRLQRVQNCAARLAVCALAHVHLTLILRHLHWLPVRARISSEIACLCFSAITSFTLPCPSDLLHLYSRSRYFRSSADTRLLKIPLYKSKTKGDRVFSYFGPVWNSLPLHIRNATIIDTFKSALKTYLFNLQESD